MTLRRRLSTRRRGLPKKCSWIFVVAILACTVLVGAVFLLGRHAWFAFDEPVIEAVGERQAAVTRIIDGDTFDIRWENGVPDRVRIKGIDTPETGSRTRCEAEAEKGLAATVYLQSLIGKKLVFLETDEKRDGFNRILATVRLADGRDVGNLLLSEGHAVKWPHDLDWCDQAATGG